MSARYLDRALPPLAGADAPADQELQRAAASAVEAYHAAMGRFHLDEALGAVMDLTSAANGYAESQAPWARNKEGDQARVGAILAAMAETCRILGHLMAPVHARPPPPSCTRSSACRSRTTTAAPAARAWIGCLPGARGRTAGRRVTRSRSSRASSCRRPRAPAGDLPEPPPRAGAPAGPRRLALPPPGPRLRRRPRGGDRAGRGGGDRAHPGPGLRPRLLAGGGRAGRRASGADRRGCGRAPALLGRPDRRRLGRAGRPRRASRRSWRWGRSGSTSIATSRRARRSGPRWSVSWRSPRRSASRCWSTTATRMTRSAPPCWAGTGPGAGGLRGVLHCFSGRRGPGAGPGGGRLPDQLRAAGQLLVGERPASRGRGAPGRNLPGRDRFALAGAGRRRTAQRADDRAARGGRAGAAAGHDDAGGDRRTGRGLSRIGTPVASTDLEQAAGLLTRARRRATIR